MAFRSMFVLFTVVAAAMAPIDVPGRHFLSVRPQMMFAAEPAVGMLKVHAIDEAGKPLPARVHLRDAEGRHLLTAGQGTRQRGMTARTSRVRWAAFLSPGRCS